MPCHAIRPIYCSFPFLGVRPTNGLLPPKRQAVSPAHTSLDERRPADARRALLEDEVNLDLGGGDGVARRRVGEDGRVQGEVEEVAPGRCGGALCGEGREGEGEEDLWVG